MTMTRTAQAARVLGEIVTAIASGNADLVGVLRKAYFACGLAGPGWELWQQWFQRELEGYLADAPLPDYRRGVPGESWWDAMGSYVAVRRALRGEAKQSEPTTMDCPYGLTEVLRWAQSGLRIPSGERRRIDRDHHEEWVTLYGPAGFQHIARVVEQMTYRFATSAYTTLTYGDALQGIWEGYRTTVEATLSQLGFDRQFESIRDGIASDNPQSWRNAMWACRDVLRDLAAHLWRDSQKTYAALTGANGKPLVVDESKYVNRLLAYLHFKGETGGAGAYLKAEIERIVSSLHTLNDLDSKAHNPVTKQDARLAAIGTYTILGEFIARTDMQPVESQNDVFVK